MNEKLRYAIKVAAARAKSLLAYSTLLAFLAAPVGAWADTFVISDTEGSAASLEALVKEGKLKWIETRGGKRLDFVNSNDKLVFLGDLSGPNWLEPGRPQNIFLRDVFLDLKTRHPTRFDFVWGNHEANRFGFIRDNVLMSRGQHVEYGRWLSGKGLKDSTEHRVVFWGSQNYGVNKEGVPPPVADYQRELSNSLNRPVSVKEAAEQFAADLKVGKPGEPHGKMVQLLITGQESTYHSGYSMTHAPIRQGSTGIIPLEAKRQGGGASWLRERNERFFKPQIKKFIIAVQSGEVPPAMLPELGDARWDAEAKRVVNDSASVTYTERAMVGDQYRGIEPEVAQRFANDPQLPSHGLLTGHKPAGNFVTAHRQEVGGKPFFDVVVDTSRGPDGIHTTVVIKDDGEIVVHGKTGEGKIERWTLGAKSDPLVGKITVDGFHIKGETSSGNYILERYSGYSLEQKVVPKSSIDSSKTSFSFEDRELNRITKAKVASLEKAIKAHGGQVLSGVDEAARITGDRFVLDLRGASKWAAVDEAKAQQIRAQLVAMAESLDPKKVVIVTGGNRAGHPNAVENMVHDIFAGPDAKKQFDIIGFMKHDTPADEVDRSVRYIVSIGDGDNWDGPVQAAQKFVSERRGATVMWGGGGILERAAETPIAAGMSDRILMVQGIGGASENKAARGVAVRSTEDIISRIGKIDDQVFEASQVKAKPLKVGIYTGSFDPPHVGHKAIVEGMKKQFGLDVVYVVPDKATAYKPGMQSFAHRKKMVEALFAGDPGIRALSATQEVALGAGEMWDVLRVVEAGHPGAKLFSIMGTDTFNWYQGLSADKRSKDVTLLVSRRDKKTALPDDVNGQKIVGVELNDQGISSTQIRNEIKAGAEPNALTSAVRQYIQKNHLYGPVVRTATPDEIRKAFKSRGKKVVTFIGYSGAEYENKAAMLERTRKVLSGFDPSTTVINIGATPEGIGEVYNIAKEMGFETTGIVSSEAQKYGSALAPRVDHVYYVKDNGWGGFVPGTNRLSPTSEAMIGVSDEIIGIGGGEVGRDEMIAARRAGKAVQFFPAEMNHSLAISKAVKKGVVPPTDFRGAAHVGLLPELKTETEIAGYFRNRGKKVVTFLGYSGAEYQDKKKMLQQARRILDRLDPKTTIINIGATPDGAGSIYQLAKGMGFETTGIVSIQAKKYGQLSPFVDRAFYVQDESWGGFKSGTDELSSTSKAMIQNSDQVISIGGGEVARDELIAARRMGKPVTFIPADMNHDLAIQKAVKKGLPAPTDFRGAAHGAWDGFATPGARLDASSCLRDGLKDLLRK